MTEEERKHKARFDRIRRVYGISEDQYETLVTPDCLVCLRPYGDSIRPVIDHDHTTGEIRGVICGYCNHRVVGRHRDPDLIQRVSDYLRGPHTGWIVPPKKRKRRRKSS